VEGEGNGEILGERSANSRGDMQGLPPTGFQVGPVWALLRRRVWAVMGPNEAFTLGELWASIFFFEHTMGLYLVGQLSGRALLFHLPRVFFLFLFLVPFCIVPS
jgi:hypothetical protein